MYSLKFQEHEYMACTNSGLNISPHLSLANHNTNEIPLGFYIHTAKYAFNYFPGMVKEEFS